MTKDQNDVYMLLLMTGREEEAIQYRKKCMQDEAGGNDAEKNEAAE